MQCSKCTMAKSSWGAVHDAKKAGGEVYMRVAQSLHPCNSAYARTIQDYLAASSYTNMKQTSLYDVGSREGGSCQSHSQAGMRTSRTQGSRLPAAARSEFGAPAEWFHYIAPPSH